MNNIQQLMTEHLDIWLNAQDGKKSHRGRGSNNKDKIYGVQKLRELILDLAVRGKLVPQDINDEPASLLLEKITVEKEKLIEEGKIKRSKPLAEIKEDEKPFELPNGWVWTYLQDISSYIQRGKSPKYTNFSDKIVVSQKCVRWEGLDLKPARFIEPSSLNNYEKIRFLVEGDILWNSTGTGTIGRASLFFPNKKNDEIVVDSHVTVVRTLGDIFNFLYLLIRSPYIQKDLESNASGTTNQVELNTSKVQKTMICLPPLVEQQRIVAKVDELMALCDQLEQQQNLSQSTHKNLVKTLLNALTLSVDADEFQQNWQRISANFDLIFTTGHSIEQLKQTVLQLAIMGKLVKQNPSDEPASLLLEKIEKEKEKLIEEGKIKRSKPLAEIKEDEKPFELPNGWVWTHLQDISSYIQRGKSPKYTNFSDKIVVSQKCVRWEGLDLKPARFIEPSSLNNYEKIRFLVEGDILWNSTGTGTIGRASLFFPNKKNDEIVVDSHVTVVRTLGDIFNFLYLLIRSPYIQKDLESNASGTTNQVELNTSKIQKTMICLPPLAEQKRIVAKVNELFNLIDNFQKIQLKLESNKKLLADALVISAI